MATDNLNIKIATEGFRKTSEALYRLRISLAAFSKSTKSRKRLFQHKDRLHRLRKRQTNRARARLYFNARFAIVDAAICLSTPIPKYLQGSGTELAFVGKGLEEVIQCNPGERIFPVFPAKMMELPSGSAIIPLGTINWTIPPRALMPRDKIQQN